MDSAKLTLPGTPTQRLDILQSNIVSCCSNVEYSRVKSSVSSSIAIVGTTQQIFTSCVIEKLVTYSKAGQYVLLR